MPSWVSNKLRLLSAVEIAQFFPLPKGFEENLAPLKLLHGGKLEYQGGYEPLSQDIAHDTEAEIVVVTERGPLIAVCKGGIVHLTFPDRSVEALCWSDASNTYFRLGLSIEVDASKHRATRTKSGYLSRLVEGRIEYSDYWDNDQQRLFRCRFGIRTHSFAWALNEEHALSTKIFDLVELSAGGSCSLWNSDTVGGGEAISASGPGGLFVSRARGSGRMEIFEGVKLIGVCCYHPHAFVNDREQVFGGWAVGYGQGHLPAGESPPNIRVAAGVAVVLGLGLVSTFFAGAFELLCGGLLAYGLMRTIRR